MNDLVRRVERAISEQQLLLPGDSVVVAVSGGPDSVALLHILRRLASGWNWRLAVAHVDHRFRGEESAQEAEFVGRLAEAWDLPCEVGKLDVPAYIKNSGENAQAAARELRYDFLFQAALRIGASKIALAHHADDQAETVLMRVLRGTGPSGLSGMVAKRTIKNMELIRPLLRIYKTELLSYCEEEGLAYCIDSSNRERKYVRNRIRLDLWPVLLEYNPRLTESIVKLADMAEAEDDFLEKEAQSVVERMTTRKEGIVTFVRTDFTVLHVALQRRCVKLILNYLSKDREIGDYPSVERVREALLREDRPSLTLVLGDSLRMVREYDRIEFSRAGSDGRLSYQYLLNRADLELDISEAGVRLAVAEEGHSSEGAAVELDGSQREAVFDADAIEWPLTIRSRRSGDRVRIFGLNGSKKVKDIFIDAKVPPRERERIPIVEDARSRILWIPGLARSETAAVSEGTMRLFRMRTHPIQE